VPHVRVEHFAPCGSLPHDERSAEWNAVVLDFLGAALGGRAGGAGDGATRDTAVLARSA
jgi:hypothetical protein